MKINLGRKSREPIIVYKIGETPEVHERINSLLELLKSIDQSALVSSSMEEARERMLKNNARTIIFVADESVPSLSNFVEVFSSPAAEVHSLIIFLAAMGNPGLASSLYESGVNVVLPWGLKPDVLRKLLQNTLEQWEASRTELQNRTDMQAILEGCPTFFWILSSPKQWIFLNEAARELVGDKRLSDWSAAVHPADMGLLIEALRSAWDDRLATVCEVRIRSLSGQFRSVQHRFKPLLDEDGKPRSIIGSGHDVTEFRINDKILNERHRYLAAYSLIQKAVQDPQKLVEKLPLFQSIASHALNARALEVYSFNTAHDFTTLAHPFTSKGSAQDEAALKETQNAVLVHAEKLGEGESCRFNGTESNTLIPLIHEGKCRGLLVVRNHQATLTGRQELDFIKNLKNLLLSSPVVVH